jgi:hypothetical protein
MSRIATVTTLLTMLVAPTAFAAGGGHAQHSQPTRSYLGSVLVTSDANPTTTAPATPTKFYMGSELVKRTADGTIVSAAPTSAPTKFYMGSELVKRTADGTIVSAAPTKAPTKVDLRSPDAKDVFVPGGHNVSPNATPQSSDNDVDWGTIGIIIAGLAACGALAVVLRRHRGVGRPLGV